MGLFTFQLKPLTDVAPWGGERPRLHWFGLTDGTYGMHVGGVDVFRYDPEGARARGFSGAVVDYQVARFWEDLLEIVPAALTPVPEDLAALLASVEAEDALLGAIDDALDRALDDEPIRAARAFVDERRLTSSHLVEGPSVLFMRTADNVLVRFDGRPRRGRSPDGGRALWSPQLAEMTLTVDAFVAELREFDTAFLAAMRERVDAVRGGALAHVEIDHEHLLREQSVEREGTLASRLNARAEADWSAVALALRGAGVR